MSLGPPTRHREGTQSATLPPPGLVGLDQAWSRLVDVVDSEGVRRRFHLLDSGSTAVRGDEGFTAGTVLCVHGNPTWSFLWRELVANPPGGWRVVAVDQLNMGWSERTGTTRRLAQRIDDLGRLTETLGIHGPVVVVAHDWGGPVSLGWASAHRDQLAGAVLTNTGVRQPAGAPEPPLIRAARHPAILGLACQRTPLFVRGATAVSRPRPPREIRDAFAAPYRSAARRQGVADFVADIPLAEDHPSMPGLRAVADDVRQFEVPVLLAWGAQDPVFGDRYLRDLIERLPHADVHRYPGASHLVTEDAPTAIDDIRRWLAALRTRSVSERPATDAPGRPRRPMTSALRERAADPGTLDQIAVAELATPGRQVTWSQLSAVVDDLAAGLSAAGVRRGDRVALLVPPGADLTAVVYACWRIGAVIVVADAGLGVRGLARALRGAWPQHVVGTARGLLAARAFRIGGQRFAAAAISPATARALGAAATLAQVARHGRRENLPSGPAADDEAAVLFTSGSTGPAKGVVYLHRQIEANRDALLDLYQVTAQDRLVAAFAPFALYGPALGIASAVPDMDVTKPSTLAAAQLAQAVDAVGATLVWASPASLRNVVRTAGELKPQERRSMASVRVVMSAGAPVPATLLTQVLEMFPAARAHTPYGMTEALPVSDIDAAELAGVANQDDAGICVGRPVQGARVSISALDSLARALGEPSARAGVTGEILVSSPWRKQRYDRLWGTESLSSRDAGWHRSGDVGHLDRDGRLWVEGRLAHVVSTAAGPVTPIAVEQRVEALPDVSAAACVGVGPVGAQVVAVVVVAERAGRVRVGLAPVHLAAAVRRVAGVDVAAVLVRRELPVDVRHNSKVDRTELSGWASERLS